MHLDDYDIVATYGAEYRGTVQYYLLATDVWRLSRLRWVAETSMLKTLAAKHRSTVSKIAAKHRAVVQTSYGKRTCFQARVERDGKQPLVARFGGIPLARHKDVTLIDRVPDRPVTYPVKELTARLRKGRCELCQQPGKVQVHQIHKLALPIRATFGARLVSAGARGASVPSPTSPVSGDPFPQARARAAPSTMAAAVAYVLRWFRGVFIRFPTDQLTRKA